MTHPYEHGYDLMENGQPGDIQPPSANADDEILIWTQRSSDHVLQLNETGHVGHLCRANDSEGVNPDDIPGLFHSFTDYGTIPWFLLNNSACKHCKNKLEEVTEWGRADYGPDGAIAVYSPSGAWIDDPDTPGPVPDVPDGLDVPDPQQPPDPQKMPDPVLFTDDGKPDDGYPDAGTSDIDTDAGGLPDWADDI